MRVERGQGDGIVKSHMIVDKINDLYKPEYGVCCSGKQLLPEVA